MHEPSYRPSLARTHALALQARAETALSDDTLPGHVRDYHLHDLAEAHRILTEISSDSRKGAEDRYWQATAALEDHSLTEDLRLHWERVQREAVFVLRAIPNHHPDPKVPDIHPGNFHVG
jgi:hypothetical protein